MGKVSIIIVNWNGKEILKNCLDSILKQSFNDYEVIVVDNGSVDNSVEFIPKYYPSFNVVALKENTGFTGGNIEGLKHAKGDFIVLLNNDAVLTPDWLSTMVSAIDSDCRIGFCSSKIIIEGTNKIDSVGDMFTTAFTGVKLGEFRNADEFSIRKYVPGACAAALIFRKSMLDEIGFLDNDFFLNHEDTDLSMRAWLAGWKCLFVPEAVVYHKVSASIGNLSDTSVYYFSRNNEWVWIKNTPLLLLIRYLPQRIIYEMSSFGYFCILKRKWRPFIKGKVAALLKLPLMLKKRKEIQKLIKLSNQEIQKELIPISKYLKDRLHQSF